LAGVRLRLRGTGGGGRDSTSTAVGGGKGIVGGTAGVGIGMAKVWDPCGVAGITLKVGAGTAAGVTTAGAGSTMESGVGEGFGADPASIGPTSTIRTSSFTSDGVVRVSGTDDDATAMSSSSMGSMRGVEGDADRVMVRGRGE
jgi:hypothetical protein